MQIQLVKYMFYFCAIASFYWFVKGFIPAIFGYRDMNVYNERMKQLDFNREKIQGNKEDVEIEQVRKLVDSITTPLIKHVMPSIEYRKDLESLERNLKFVGGDKYFTAIQYTVLIIAGRAVGATAFLLFAPFSIFMSFLWFFALAVFPSLLFSNSIKNKKEALLLGFPEFISISKSYLVSGMSFEKAVEESIMYVNKEWRDLLKSFLINSRTLSRKECLKILAEESNLFEIKEFMSLVQLNMEQGIDVKDSFERQYGKIKALQNLSFIKKIESRKVWVTLVQGPVLLTILVAFGIQTFESMLSMGSLM